MENQAIQLTPPGFAAIAVVRLIGPGVAAFLSRHFSRPAQPGRCVHGILADGDRVIDDPVVVLIPDGAADINLHGGLWVVRAMLDLARREGFTVIESPAHLPSPPQAVDGESELDREIAAYLPLARSELGIRVLLAQAEAWANFKAESASADELNKMLEDRSLHHLLHPPTVAIVGAANVGKSTLANQLFGQERSITADIAGTTRDWVGEIANVDGLPVMLVDTPGQRMTDDAIEQAAIAGSRATIAASQLIILVLDATRPLEPEQSHLLKSLSQSGALDFVGSALRTVLFEGDRMVRNAEPTQMSHGHLAAYPNARLVINKCDKPWAWDVTRMPAIQTTATTGAGVDTLRRAIASHFGCGDLEMSQPRWWTPRQREILRQVIADAAKPKDATVAESSSEHPQRR